MINFPTFLSIKNFILLILIIISYSIGYLKGRNDLNKFWKFNKKKKFFREISKFVTFSEYLEDYILFSIFYDVKNGFYIDIGANDPNLCSVTKAFYLRGWHGINIEPLPDKYKSLQLNRKKDINLNICIGKIEGNGTFYLQRGLSTLIKKYIRNGMNIKL